MKTDDLEFSLKPIRTIADVGSSFSLVNNPGMEMQNESCKLYVTDFGDVIYMDKESDILQFNDINLFEPNRGKFGYKYKSKEKNDIDSLNWCFSQKGAIGYTEESAYFVGVKMKNDKVKADNVVKIDFQINPEKLKIKKIHGCPNSNYIMIALHNKYDEVILLVWDLKKNAEKYNYSVEGDYSFISKPDSEFGIIL